MIEINFLPPEVKKKKSLPVIPSGLAVKIFSTVIAILVGIHVVILLIMFAGKLYLGMLNKKVTERRPRSEEITSVRSGIKKLEEEQAVIDQLFGKRIIWAQKLNILSDTIPAGIWLDRFILTDKLFSLEATAVSLKSDEMKLISSFLDDLKRLPAFYSDFEDLALKSIQRRSIKAIEVVDFNIAGLLKQ